MRKNFHYKIIYLKSEWKQNRKCVIFHKCQFLCNISFPVTEEKSIERKEIH